MNIKFNVIHGVDHTKPFRRTLYQSTGSNIPEDANPLGLMTSSES